MVHGEVIWNIWGYLEYYLTNNHLPTERKSSWLPLSSRNVLFWYKQQKKNRYLWYICTVFGHCVFCSFSIYGFWLPFCYLQNFLIEEGRITDARIIMIVWSLSYNIYLYRLHCWYIGVDKQINWVHNLFYWDI